MTKRVISDLPERLDEALGRFETKIGVVARASRGRGSNYAAHQFLESASDVVAAGRLLGDAQRRAAEALEETATLLSQIGGQHKWVIPEESPELMACSSHWRAANPPPDPRAWAAIEDPAARTETALHELYAFYGRTERMYASLLRDEPLVPIVQLLLRDFYGYLRSIEDVLMAGRGLRGRAARRTHAAIGHALAFPTWRSLTHEQGLADDDAIVLLCLLVEGAAPARSGR